MPRKFLLLTPLIALGALISAQTVFATPSATPNPLDLGTYVVPDNGNGGGDVTYSVESTDPHGPISSQVINTTGLDFSWYSANHTCPTGTLPPGSQSCTIGVSVSNQASRVGTYTATLRITNGSSVVDVPIKVTFVDQDAGGGKKKCHKKGKKSAVAAKKCKKHKK
jgi:hypothetical protein